MLPLTDHHQQTILLRGIYWLAERKANCLPVTEDKK